MSKLLTLGILQQVQNAGGGGEAGVLYDGEMTIQYVDPTPELGYFGWGEQFGSINPDNVTGWTECYVGYGTWEPMGNDEYRFISDYPDIGNNLAHYEFGGTVYTTLASLYTYLASEAGGTISLKVYEDAQQIRPK